MSPDHFKTIFYIVVVLFVVTFLFTLLTLPGWIKIEEKYRKPLFYGFIAELGIAFFAFFKMEDAGYITDPPASDWVGLNVETKKLVQPVLYLKNDTSRTIISHLGKSVKDATGSLNDNNLRIEITEDNGIQVKSDADQFLGKIPKERFKFFNTIIPSEQALVSNNKATIKFESRDNNAWYKSEGLTFLKDGSGFDIIVEDVHQGTGYKIIQKVSDKEDVVWFDSFQSEETRENAFNIKTRIVHTYEYNNDFYIIFVQSADLTSETKRYVHFQQLKLVPGIKKLSNQ